MDHCRKHLLKHRPGLLYAVVLCTVAILNVLPGCVTTKPAPEMAWVRTDGRRIADDPALLQQGKTDMGKCARRAGARSRSGTDHRGVTGSGATSLRAIADGLNDLKIPTARVNTWSPVQVARVLARQSK
jgi:hypothetical protein